MQDPGSQNPYGGPNSPYNPYGNYNPYNPQPPNAKQQVFGGAVTQDERSMAMLAHLLQIFSSFIGPLVIYVVKKDQSKFVAYHALQCLAWHVCYIVFMVAGLFLTVALTITMPPHGPNGFPVFVVFFWLLAVGMGLLNMVLSIVYAIKSYHGDWSGYPIIGNFVRRFL